MFPFSWLGGGGGEGGRPVVFELFVQSSAHYLYVFLKWKPFNLTKTNVLTWHISFLCVHTRKELSLQLSVIFVFVEPPATGEHHSLTQRGGIHYHLVQEPTGETTLVIMADPTTRILK